jgi:hypothetical protein
LPKRSKNNSPASTTRERARRTMSRWCEC